MKALLPSFISCLLIFSLPLQAESYHAPSWALGGHFQTLYSTLIDASISVDYRRERWDTPDGDFIDLDWVEGPEDAPLVVFFHGLEGSSGSHSARGLMDELIKRNWRGVVVHFRGCSGEPNLLPRAYHGGDTQEIDWILRRLRTQNPNTFLYAVGNSLGGNALLKWVGEQADRAQDVIEAAATVSAPVDLQACGYALDTGFNRIYARFFLRSLKRKALGKLERYPLLYDRHSVENISTLYQFDTLVTARLHGFKDADDYWRRASSKSGLKDIALPTLLINSYDDPFMPGSALPKFTEVSPYVSLEFSKEGGHNAFISGSFPGNLSWAPARVLSFFDQVASEAKLASLLSIQATY